MAQYRRSYVKTIALATVGATGCFLIGLMFLLATVVEWPGMETVRLLPSAIRGIAGAIFVGLALFGYIITAGGLLALHYDAKGRAVF
ncbi:MAG: hypothetical protein OEV08_00815 [Nitrospira sp.]|nr:hypothetical protein [Nitrospira sp.]